MRLEAVGKPATPHAETDVDSRDKKKKNSDFIMNSA